MIWHPLTLALWWTDLLAWGIYLAAAGRLLSIIPQWRPEGSGQGQLQREHALELVVYSGRWTLAFQVITLVLLVAGISNVWPAYIPGAMCGTGVLQAMGGWGWQAVGFRLLAVLTLFCWQAVVAIDRAHPRSPLALVQARLLLLAAPCMAWASIASWRALAALKGAGPVSCCAVVYDRGGGIGGFETSILPSITATAWWGLGLGASLLMAGWALGQWRHPAGAGQHPLLLSLPLVTIWTACTMTALRFGVGPYIYQVLYHPCPWCFFLGEHHYIGILLFGLPLGIVAESGAAMTAASIARQRAVLAAPAMDRVRQAGLHVLLFVAAFLVVTVAPVMLWRLRFGAWID